MDKSNQKRIAVRIIDSHEVAIDAVGHGRDIWTCKWSGMDKAQIFRGDFINNRINLQHLFTIPCSADMSVKEFCDWAVGLLTDLIEEETNVLKVSQSN